MLIRGLDGFDACLGGIVSIGNFDGVHLGHQLMIQTLVTRPDLKNYLLLFSHLNRIRFIYCALSMLLRN